MESFIVAGVRTPISRYGGALAKERPDGLAALVIGEAVGRAGAGPARIDEVVLGAANQAREDNRNVAPLATLLADFPDTVPGHTVNRLCASEMAGKHLDVDGPADLPDDGHETDAMPVTDSDRIRESLDCQPAPSAESGASVRLLGMWRPARRPARYGAVDRTTGPVPLVGLVRQVSHGRRCRWRAVAMGAGQLPLSWLGQDLGSWNRRM